VAHADQGTRNPKPQDACPPNRACSDKKLPGPELANAYDRYQLKINERAAALVREAADAVLFARFETELVRDGGSRGTKAKVRGEGNRIMYTESRPGFDAKNRFNLPFAMPLDWKTFGDAIRAFYGLIKRERESARATATNAGIRTRRYCFVSRTERQRCSEDARGAACFHTAQQRRQPVG
jgi:hypothetical protein